MAVNKSSNQNQRPTQQSAPQQNGTTQSFSNQQGDRMEQQKERRMFVGINQSVGRRQLLSQTEGRLSEFSSAFRSCVQHLKETGDLNDQLDLRIFPINRSQIRMPVNTLVLVFPDTSVNNEKAWLARPLIIDSEKEDYPTTFETNPLNGQRLELKTCAEDFATANYLSAIEGELIEQLGTEASLFIADPLDIPREFDPKDEAGVSLLLADCLGRAQDAASFFVDQSPFNVADMIDEKARFVATPTYDDSEPAVSLTGLPIRSDITIALRRRIAGANTFGDGSTFNGVTTELINTVSGFIALYPVSSPNQSSVNGYFGQQAPEMNYKCFSPQFVITNAAQENPAEAQTLEMFLLSLVTGYFVTSAANWVTTFLPRMTVGRDLKDITGLGYYYQAKSGRLQGVKESADPVNEIGAILRECLIGDATGTPSLGMMFDACLTGENGQHARVFIDAANGVPEATQEIIAAAHRLTNGNFPLNFDAPVAMSTGQLIPLGYYTDETGAKRDRRDIDALAALNITEEDTAAFYRWISTFSSNVTSNPKSQMKLREDQEATWIRAGRTTSYARRLAIMPKFVTQLFSSLGAAGLNVTMENTHQGTTNSPYLDNSIFTSNLLPNVSAAPLVNTVDGQGNNQNSVYGAGRYQHNGYNGF